MSEIRMFERFEPNVSRGVLKNCQLCKQKFGPFKTEHQCKRCLRAVCSGCQLQKKDMYKPGMVKSPHKPCKHCSIQSSILAEYVAAQKLKFGKDSSIGKKWLDKIPTNRISSPMNIKQHRKFPMQTFNELWDAYNFSIRQFMGILTFTMAQSEVYGLVNNVYVQLQSRGVEQKMENMILIIIFMLCFAGPETCVELIQYLISLKKTVTDQKQMLYAYLKTLGVDQTKSKQLTDYINLKLKQFVGPISINGVTTECSIYAISKAFEKQRIDETYMLLSIVLHQNWEELVANRDHKLDCDFVIVRNCDMSLYKGKFTALASVDVSSFASIRAKSNSVHKAKIDLEQMDSGPKKKQEQVIRDMSKKSSSVLTISDIKLPQNINTLKKKQSINFQGIMSNMSNNDQKKQEQSDDEDNNLAVQRRSSNKNVPLDKYMNLFAQFSQNLAKKQSTKQEEESTDMAIKQKQQKQKQQKQKQLQNKRKTELEKQKQMQRQKQIQQLKIKEIQKQKQAQRQKQLKLQEQKQKQIQIERQKQKQKQQKQKQQKQRKIKEQQIKRQLQEKIRQRQQEIQKQKKQKQMQLMQLQKQKQQQRIERQKIKQNERVLRQKQKQQQRKRQLELQRQQQERLRAQKQKQQLEQKLQKQAKQKQLKQKLAEQQRLAIANKLVVQKCLKCEYNTVQIENKNKLLQQKLQQLNITKKQLRISEAKVKQLINDINEIKILKNNSDEERQITMQQVKSLRNEVKQNNQKNSNLLKQLSKVESQNKNLINQLESINLKNKTEKQNSAQQSNTKIDNLMKQLKKYQKQNANLTNLLNEANQNNKFLKQTMELELKNKSNTAISKNNSNNQQLKKQCQLMRLRLQQKNKQIVLLRSQKNQYKSQCESTAQKKIKGSQNDNWEQKAKSLQKQNQSYIAKLQQISAMVLKEEQQKLGLSEQLFELKQKQIKRSQSVIVERTTSAQNKAEGPPSKQMLTMIKEKTGECNIF